jgi:hypothetical protein
MDPEGKYHKMRPKGLQKSSGGEVERESLGLAERQELPSKRNRRGLVRRLGLRWPAIAGKCPSTSAGGATDYPPKCRLEPQST